MRQTKRQHGFTLIELLITIVIIGVLTGVLLLSIVPFESKAKKEVCYHNRSAIIRALATYRLIEACSKENCALSDFLANGYGNFIDNNTTTCPSGGVYTAGEVDGVETVICSIHSVASSTDPTPVPIVIPIPGTDLFGGSGYIAPDDWAETYVDTSHIGFTEGQKFLYEGDYYIAIGTMPNLWVGNNFDPDQAGVDWNAQSGGGLIKFTGVSKDWNSSEVVTGTVFKRGDIVFYNGSYYVCKVQGGTGVFSVTKGQYWNNAPDSSSGEWGWYKLTN